MISVFLSITIRLCPGARLILVPITSVNMDSVKLERRREATGVNVREDTQGNSVT